jgi:hypothetical protein
MGLVVLSAVAAEAGTWQVGRDPGDCPGGCNFHDLNSGLGQGITDAMVSLEVLPGDTVLVYPDGGRPYSGKVTMKSGVVLTSAGGPAVTMILGNAGAEAAIFMVATDPLTEVSGFTFTWGSGGDGLGAGVAAWVASGRIRNNVFFDNAAGEGSAVYMQSCNDFIVENNLFLANNSTAGGGAVAISGGAPTVRRNTFTANYTPFGFEGASLYAAGSSFTFERNIVHGSRGAAAIFCASGNTPTISCNLFWDNPFGAFAGQCVDSVGTSGNISGDPLFCPGDGNFGLCADSPALTAPCGPIGYLPPTGHCAACGPPPSAIAVSTWGHIKSLYR